MVVLNRTKKDQANLTQFIIAVVKKIMANSCYFFC